MTTSSYFQSRSQGEQPISQGSRPSWLNNRVTSLLQFISVISCYRPIYTVVIFAALASFSYLGLLENSFIDTTRHDIADWKSIIEGSRSARTGPDSSWQWQVLDAKSQVRQVLTNEEHRALLTLVFQRSSLEGELWNPSLEFGTRLSQNLSITTLPSTTETLRNSSEQDSALTFSMLYEQIPEFWSAIQEISDHATNRQRERSQNRIDERVVQQDKTWVLKGEHHLPRASLAEWVHNSWVEFCTLFKHASSVDVTIMVVMYSATLLTFVSLFFSMRRIGSNFWVAAGAIFSTVFSFLFALFITASLSVPITLILLSEGMPFLIVFVSFDKYIALTRIVLSQAIRNSLEKSPGKTNHSAGNSHLAISMGIKQEGFVLFQQYLLQIGLTTFIALAGTEGGLQQFCFFSAWLLLFDCISLFTFFTAVLCIKLEINKIKRRVDVRQALEDDGISHAVAEDVAQNGNSADSNGRHHSSTNIFGRQISSAQATRFKFVMVVGFFLVNTFNLYNAPFKSASSWAQSIRGLESPQIEPLKVVPDGMDALLTIAKDNQQPMVVTVLAPIKYKLEQETKSHNESRSDIKNEGERIGNVMRYRLSEQMLSVLKGLEDPFLSKWILCALILSVAFNGYLFNATVSDLSDADDLNRRIDRQGLEQAQMFNSPDLRTLPQGECMESSSSEAALSTTSTEKTIATPANNASAPKFQPEEHFEMRSLEQMEKMLQTDRANDLMDNEIIDLGLRGKIPGHALEKILKNHVRAVKIRRKIISRTEVCADSINVLEESNNLPYDHYDWTKVFGACCENVIGYMPVPVGVAGPLVVDGRSYFIPMATTEGVLVASTSRGCKAINAGGGAVTVLTGDGMTRGPCVKFERLERTGAAKLWLDSDEGQAIMKKAFNSTSRFARLGSLKTTLAGTHLFIRFKTTTGDAMGMNMISKGVECALRAMASEGFEDMNIVSLSGNYCADKKPSAINWIEGRGKSVTAEAIIPADIIRSVLKADVKTIVELNKSKNLVGSAVAGSIGGFNAHAANIVAAMFIATGQDPAQVVESSNCITLMDELEGSLQISVSMPSLEVGTLGGGTILEPQGTMLDMLGVRGPHPSNPGENSRRLARIIAAAALAGELSLCSALAAGHLVRAHMQHNRTPKS